MRIIDADLENEEQLHGILDVLDAYAREPAGGEEPIPASVRERLIRDLRKVDIAVVLAALDDTDEIVGIAVCFRGYSTFKARPLLNIHDLAVLPSQRGRGVGRALLAAAEDKARADGCCKLTLEVLDDNVGARRLYERYGFGDGGPGQRETTTLFMQKPL
ncbi:MAG: GNAT family N-acetyltransferase [Gammaproteobacteria bacterium]